METHFSPETTEFLWGIRLNNDRDWFNPRKQIYIQHVYEPLKELSAQVQSKVNAAFPKAMLNCHVTRIYRDARRLHDRGPYKDHLWFTLRTRKENWISEPVFYFELSPEGFETGIGYYCPKPAQMEAYRSHVLRHPEELEKLARRLNRQKDFTLDGPEYKRSKGNVSPLLQPWFNRKSISLCRFRQTDELLYSPNLAEEVAADFIWLMPFYQFFKALELEQDAQRFTPPAGV